MSCIKEDYVYSIRKIWSCYWLDLFLTSAFNTWISSEFSMFPWIRLVQVAVRKKIRVNDNSSPILSHSWTSLRSYRHINVNSCIFFGRRFEQVYPGFVYYIFCNLVGVEILLSIVVIAVTLSQNAITYCLDSI